MDSWCWCGSCRNSNCGSRIADNPPCAIELTIDLSPNSRHFFKTTLPDYSSPAEGCQAPLDGVVSYRTITQTTLAGPNHSPPAEGCQAPLDGVVSYRTITQTIRAGLNNSPPVECTMLDILDIIRATNQSIPYLKLETKLKNQSPYWTVYLPLENFILTIRMHISLKTN